VRAFNVDILREFGPGVYKKSFFDKRRRKETFIASKVCQIISALPTSLPSVLSAMVTSHTRAKF
jgi:hypothetical protein